LRGDQNSVYQLEKEMDVTTEEELGSALSRSVCFAIAHMSKSLPIYAMADKIRHKMSQKHNT
jgi:hypothetical protein